MKNWYRSYWSQTWYANTFLVRKPSQIAQAVANDREWNTVHDSGCNFTCLAMIVGLDPGRLASELRTSKYFFSDPSLRALRLDGKTMGLVWDQNAPNHIRPSVSLNKFWHPDLRRRTSLNLAFVGSTSTRSYEAAWDRISEIRSRGNHAICGPIEHSHLVAGTNSGEYFLWDPDGSETSVEDNLSARFTLSRLFDTYSDADIEFWEYECVFELPSSGATFISPLKSNVRRTGEIIR